MAVTTLEELRQRLAWPGATAAAAAALPVGVRELGRLLPQGYRERSLVEWLGEPGGGAGTLALRTALAAAAGRPIALVGAAEQCHPSALAALGLPLERLLLAEPRTAKEFAWTMEEALRCPAVGAVVAWPVRVHERAGRRWQLAAESGCRLGLLVREPAAEREPCWAGA
jgi:protein ImuA